MSESTPPAGISPLSSTVLRGASLVQVGGALGIAACVLGLLIFILACAGLHAVFVFSLIPLLLSAPGMVLALIGAIGKRGAQEVDTQVLASFFVNLIGLIGALVLIAAWREWQVFG